MEDLKNSVFSKEFNDTFNGEQLRDIKKEIEIGNKLYCLGLQLQSMKHMGDVLAKLEEIDLYLSRIDQADCMLFNWAVQPSMVALVQPKFMKHSCGDVRILVASCLSEIIRITTPTIPYVDNILEQVLQHILDSLDGINDSKNPTFGKQTKILELMLETKFFIPIFDFGWERLTQQLLQSLLRNYRKHHPDNVRVRIKNILLSILNEDDVICEQLRSILMATWRCEDKTTLTACEFAEELIEHNIEKFSDLMTDTELMVMGIQVTGSPALSRNQIRKEEICFTCHEAWSLGHNCENNREEEAIQEVQISVEEMEDQHSETQEMEPAMGVSKEYTSIMFADLEVSLDKHHDREGGNDSFCEEELFGNNDDIEGEITHVELEENPENIAPILGDKSKNLPKDSPLTFDEVGQKPWSLNDLMDMLLVKEETTVQVLTRADDSYQFIENLMHKTKMEEMQKGSVNGATSSQLLTIMEAFKRMKSDYLQLLIDRDLAIKFGEDKEEEIDELCLQLSMTQSSLYQAENQISMTITFEEVDLDPRTQEVIQILEGIHTLGENEDEYSDSTLLGAFEACYAKVDHRNQHEVNPENSNFYCSSYIPSQYLEGKVEPDDTSSEFSSDGDDGIESSVDLLDNPLYKVDADFIFDNPLCEMDGDFSDSHDEDEMVSKIQDSRSVSDDESQFQDQSDVGICRVSTTAHSTISLYSVVDSSSFMSWLGLMCQQIEGPWFGVDEGSISIIRSEFPAFSLPISYLYDIEQFGTYISSSGWADRVSILSALHLHEQTFTVGGLLSIDSSLRHYCLLLFGSCANMVMWDLSNDEGICLCSWLIHGHSVWMVAIYYSQERADILIWDPGVSSIDDLYRCLGLHSVISSMSSRLDHRFIWDPGIAYGFMIA